MTRILINTKDLRKNLLVSLETRFGVLCKSNLIRLSTILHPNIGLSVFEPKYHDEIKSDLKYELSLLHSFVNDKENETKETDENSPKKKIKQNI
jgi:hypothetical protein